MAKTKLFMNNRTQAVRLPKDVAFPDGVEEVEVYAVGESRIITPARESWASWFAAESVTDDYLAERHQPPPQERDDS